MEFYVATCRGRTKGNQRIMKHDETFVIVPSRGDDDATKYDFYVSHAPTRFAIVADQGLLQDCAKCPKALEAVPLPERASQFASTPIVEPEESFTRREEDIAIAAELLQAGLVNEREIVAAVSDWSIHGSVSLTDHLEKRQLLRAEQIDALRQRAVGAAERPRAARPTSLIAEGASRSHSISRYKT
ncbi:hypothetical protein [Lacipirellula limnantheis]|uniref:Uncharacterized protein n=1 Tax=Lacipirellula limnantheis TaxID=2528024 RepID=A0A517TVX5_9BACT|nr:hypothetical protein [Lacipirellula limnantheis]QDT72516.1 hypothetical protein I41_16960 [Lacipirellula limnantheis]